MMYQTLSLVIYYKTTIYTQEKLVNEVMMYKRSGTSPNFQFHVVCSYHAPLLYRSVTYIEDVLSFIGYVNYLVS